MLCICFALLLHAIRRHTLDWSTEWTLTTDLWEPAIGQLMAFGDFDNDHYVDALFLDNDQLRLYCYDRDKKKMRQFQFNSPTPYDVNSGDATIQLSAPTSYPTVKNIIPLDANFDGFLDILIIYGNDQSRYQYHILQNDGKSELEFTHNYIVPGEFNVEPLVADLNMDGIPDLLTQNSESIQIVASKINKDGDIAFESPRNWASMFDVNDAIYANAKLRDPHGSAIIDIDGDCKLDIALVLADDWIRFFSSYTMRTTNVEIDVRWRPLLVHTNSTENGNGAALMDVHIDAAGHPVFVDANADGTNDILFPVLDSSSRLEVRAIYNREQPICRSPLWPESDCRASKNLCQVCSGGMCDNVRLDAPVTVFASDQGILPMTSQNLPNVWMRMADYNNDMYPDILVHTDAGVSVLAGGDKREGADGEVIGFTMPCDSYNAPESKIARATFFDSGPHFGWKNVLVQTDAGLHVFSWAARESRDGHTYHLTTSGLSGVCVVTSAQGCPKAAKDADTNIRRDGYGQNYPGFMFKLAVTNFQGFYIPRVSTQLAQQTYGALQEPNVHFGLMQSNNYVSEFFTSLTVPPPKSCVINDTTHEYNRKNCPYHRHWVGSAIIPNTALRVIPYRRAYPHEWGIELEVSPTKDMVTILLVSSGVLLALGGLIAFNEYRDRKKQEKRQYRDFRVHFIG